MTGNYIQIPSRTEAQRDALSTAPNGAMLYNTDRMSFDFTVDGAATWQKVADSLNSSPRNIVYVSTDGDDTHGTGTISSPFRSLSHAVDTILTSSFSNPFLVYMAAGTYVETGVVDVPPGVTIDGGGSVLDLSGGTLQLRASEWNEITEGFFNFVNFFNVAFPSTVNLDLSGTSGDQVSIFIGNITPFFAYSTITITGSATNYINIFLENILEGNSQIAFNLNNANIFSNNISFAETIITVDNGLGYQHKFNNSASFNTFNVNVDGALSESIMTCNTVIFNNAPVFTASNGGEIQYGQLSCSSSPMTFNNTGGTGGTITADLGIINSVPVLIGTPSVTYNILLGDTLSLRATNIDMTSDGGSMNMTQALNASFEEGFTINNNNNGIEIKTGNGDFKAEATSGTLLLTGSSGMTMKIDNGQWNMDMTTGGNPSTWHMSSDFYMDFPYGGGTFNVTTPDDINLHSTAGSVNILADSGNITLGSPATALVTIPVQNIQVGDYSEAGTTSVVLSGGSVSANTAGAPALSLDGGSEVTTLSGAETNINGNNSITLNSSSGDINITPSNALQVTAGGNLNLTSSGTDVVLTASSGSIQLTGSTVGFFGGGPVGQSAPIADSTVLLTDVVTQFNTLLAYLRSIGLIET